MRLSTQITCCALISRFKKKKKRIVHAAYMPSHGLSISSLLALSFLNLTAAIGGSVPLVLKIPLPQFSQVLYHIRYTHQVPKQAYARSCNDRTRLSRLELPNTTLALTYSAKAWFSKESPTKGIQCLLSNLPKLTLGGSRGTLQLSDSDYVAAAFSGLQGKITSLPSR